MKTDNEHTESHNETHITETHTDITPGCEEYVQTSSLPVEMSELTGTIKPASTMYNIDSDEAAGTGETTHISVVDSDGNAVSLYTTLSPVFGWGAWVNVFILNYSGYIFD